MDIQTRTSQFDAETRHIADNLDTGICIIRRIIRINVAVIRVSVDVKCIAVSACIRAVIIHFLHITNFIRDVPYLIIRRCTGINGNITRCIHTASAIQVQIHIVTSNGVVLDMIGMSRAVVKIGKRRYGQ